ncbi:MAG: cytidine deaminase [Phascolarctobacterium sp.]|uniref:cytidine deaminase n=1 Tax=Phascolarctobacterium sp. TaxID=2049039 RepID=UPI0025F6068F|nr:cytidine deaminase [Phascolarctobacterium sp.]MCC8158080.1 cytidine deaminase [Phascolarctobacterium sp.]
MDKKLLAAALAARENAYAPYSKFKVGAAVETADGHIFTGCNVENASYGLTCCAERNAVFAAIGSGARSFKVLCVVADTEEPVAPCGACRQVLAEFPFEKIILANCKGLTKVMTVAELLPYSFGPEALEPEK